VIWPCGIPLFNEKNKEHSMETLKGRRMKDELRRRSFGKAEGGRKN
jgi:hypothetical protein